MAYHIMGYQTNPITGETIFSILCDTIADLPNSPVSDNGYGGEIGQGSKAVIIADGSSYLADSNRQWIYQPNPNAWVNVYTKSEIESMITTIYQYMIYYHSVQESADGSITFYSFGGIVGNLTIYGNGEQIGTPTPDNPVMPEFVGTLDGSDWTIPITCAGQTTPVYLGQTQTVRKIRKLVLTGQESWSYTGGQAPFQYLPSNFAMLSQDVAFYVCSHYKSIAYNCSWTSNDKFVSASAQGLRFKDSSFNQSLDDFKAYLASEYTAGHPVTVWYVLAEPETGIVNEPLAKIGDYADELHSTDAGVSIPTAKGQNTLTVETELQPSKIEISGE